MWSAVSFNLTGQARETMWPFGRIITEEGWRVPKGWLVSSFRGNPEWWRRREGAYVLERFGGEEDVWNLRYINIRRDCNFWKSFRWREGVGVKNTNGRYTLACRVRNKADERRWRGHGLISKRTRVRYAYTWKYSKLGIKMLNEKEFACKTRISTIVL